MAEVTYRPAHIKGEVRIPPSKSAAHRALLSAALCKTPCRVGPIDHSADMEATLNGVCAMGGTVKAEENGVLCIAPGTAPQSVTVDSVNPVPRCAFSSPFSPPSASKRRLSVAVGFPSALSAFTQTFCRSTA